ncbi:MAG: ATP-grasp domain-containing protein [Clostridium sp.]|nr:ATP-grasp domain-containing protein [Clostridium sp.]
MRRILVTAISGDIGNGVLKILQEEKDVLLFGCDCNAVAVGMDLVSKFWQCPLAVHENYIDFILKICENYNIEYLIPVNEREIEIIGKNRHLFDARNIKLVIQQDNVLNICLDKARTMEFLDENGFDIPKTLSNIKYICKPRKSNGSKNMIVGNLLEALDSDDYIIQEYIEGEGEYTVGIFKNADIENIIAFRRVLKNGYSYQVELVKDKKLHEIAHKVATLLNLSGYINIQLMLKNKRYYIFEINPRISGTVRFRDGLGFRDVIWWLDMLDGKKVEQYECKCKKAVGIKELNEKFLIKE